MKGGFHPWLKDIDPRSREKETAIRIQDQAQSCLLQEFLFRKLVSVLDAIRGKDAETALAILAYNPRYASTVIDKLLKSAIANAENNNGMDRSKLFIEECYASNGPIMKRVQPRAQGRAYRIEKRMSHITIVLNER